MAPTDENHHALDDLWAIPSAPKPASSTVTPKGNFIVRHWRGDYGLARSFFVNCFAIGIGWRVLTLSIDSSFTAQTPLLYSMGFLLFAHLFTLPIAVWQLVGLWRAADRAASRGTARGWRIVVKAFVVVGCLGLLSTAYRVIIPQSVEAIEVLMGDQAFGESEVRVLGDSREAEVYGALRMGTAQRLRNLLAEIPDIDVIHLNSIGGRLGEAMQIKNLVEENGLRTFVSTQCLSACTIAFLGGTERYIAPNAEIGFHRADFSALTQDERDQTNRALAEEFYEKSIDREFTDKAFSTPHDSMWYPTHKELLESGFVDAISSDEFVLSGFGTEQTPERVARDLKQTPIYSVIEKVDPEAFDQIVRIWALGTEAGISQFEMEVQTRLILQDVVQRKERYFSDEAVIALFTLVGDQLEALSVSGPELCDALLSEEPDGPTIAARALPTSFRERELQILADALASSEDGIEKPVKMLSEDDLIATVMPYYPIEDTAEAVALSASAETERQAARAGCLYYALFFKAFANMPPEQAGALLRGMRRQGALE